MVPQVEQGAAADRGESSVDRATSLPGAAPRKDRAGGLAGAYRQRLQLFLQVRY